MIVALLIFFFLVGFLLIKAWTFLVNLIFKPFIGSESKESNNPYIEAHLMRRGNDKLYQEYLEWLNQDSGDLPIGKILPREEWEFEQELKNQI